MRTRRVVIAIGILVTVILPRAAAQGDSGRVAFEAARKIESVDGDLRAAIEQYKAIAAGSDRSLAAQALLRLAGCYRKLGSAEAQTVYERVVREFPDVAEVAALARAHLDGPTEAQVGPSLTLRKVWEGDISGTISRDGRRLSYNDWAKGQVAVRDLVEGTSRPVTASDYNAFESAISKDGTAVAYTWINATGGVELRMTSADGKGLAASRRLLGGEGGEDLDWISPMDWSPDGRLIVVTVRRRDRTTQVAIVRVPEGRLTVLKSVDWRGPTRIFFSPDGRYLGFDLPVNDSADQRDVFVLAVDGSRETPAVVHPGQDVMMGWSPDGKHLLFASDRRDGSMGLWTLPIEDGRPRGAAQFKSNIGTGWSLGVDGSGSVYLGMRAGDGDVAFVTLDLAAGKQVGPPVKPVQSFVGSNTQPHWSPDGTSLAYASVRGFNPSQNLNGRVIVVQNLATGALKELRPQLSIFNQFSWSPDGRAFYAGGTDSKGRKGIFRIDAQTAETVRLIDTIDTEEGGNGYPRWSPDGSKIYYRHDGIVERDLATGRERQVIGDVLANGPINLSPDGRWIVMGAANRTGASTLPTHLVLISVAGGEMRELLRVDPPDRFAAFQGMPWMPDGQGFLVRKRVGRTSSEIWYVPLAGSPRKLDVDTTGWSYGAIGPLSLHPDGRRLAFLMSSSRPASEVWTLEHFLAAPPGSR
jgi:Tol biopolymer transport system component